VWHTFEAVLSGQQPAPEPDRSNSSTSGPGDRLKGKHMRRIAALVAVAALGLTACTGESAPEEYSVENQPAAAASFVSPTDGDTVTSPMTVVLAADGVELTPAGIPAIGEGHLHVMVDIGCYPTGESIPGPSEQDEAAGRFHLGTGADTREIDLAPGTYELCVQLADGVHTAFGATETITVTVVE